MVEFPQTGFLSREASILDSLPAHIAVLDPRGVILTVNQAWRRFADANLLCNPLYAVGQDYLSICDTVTGDEQADARHAAQLIRAVLAGRSESVAWEYPCHSPQKQRWYLLNVSPIASDAQLGAIVMHTDITQIKQAQQRIAYLSRLQSMLSGINSLIVRVSSREELFREACRIAVEAGGFLFARIGIVDESKTKVYHAALSCSNLVLTNTMERALAAEGTIPSALVAEAISAKQPATANNLDTDPRAPHLGGQFGVRSKAVIPIVIGNDVFGIFCLYANESQFFHAEEVNLLSTLAGDIAHAIDHIEKEDRLHQLAYYDVLTGLGNRSLLLERIAQFIGQSSAVTRQLAIIVFGLERFQIVNDSLGRSVEDVLLRQISEWFSFIAGDRELLFRVDTDRFVLLLPDVRGEQDVADNVERTLAALLDHSFRLTEDAEFKLSVKAGVALFPADGTLPGMLLHNAEAAWRQAKSSADHYLFYRQKMSEAVKGRLALETQLHQALERREFVLHYQPKVSLADGTLTGAEALIRWQNPRSGLVAPMLFIPVLEETGLICEVGLWVLRQAIDDFLRWRRAGLSTIPLAVNVSAIQLHDPRFVSQIEQAIGQDPAAAGGLELEITESIIMQDVNHGMARLQAIRDMGVKIAIDDFGTGFSSLSYLSKLPVDALKIDRSFIAQLATASKSHSLVSSIIGLAHSLDLKVVAEGVESEKQSGMLRLLNCDEMQGYLFSKPLPTEVFEKRFLISS